MSLHALLDAARRQFAPPAPLPPECRTGIFSITRVFPPSTALLDAERIGQEMTAELDHTIERARRDGRDYICTVAQGQRTSLDGGGEQWCLNCVLLLQNLADATVSELVNCGGKWTEEVAARLRDRNTLLHVRIPVSTERFEIRTFTPALFRVRDGTKQFWAWERVR